MLDYAIIKEYQQYKFYTNKFESTKSEVFSFLMNRVKGSINELYKMKVDIYQDSDWEAFFSSLKDKITNDHIYFYRIASSIEDCSNKIELVQCGADEHWVLIESIIEEAYKNNDVSLYPIISISPDGSFNYSEDYFVYKQGGELSYKSI